MAKDVPSSAHRAAIMGHILAAADSQQLYKIIDARTQRSTALVTNIDFDVLPVGLPESSGLIR